MKADHGLDDRKLKILQTIIKTYLETRGTGRIPERFPNIQI
mgnify:CR=1 FL=1